MKCRNYSINDELNVLDDVISILERTTWDLRESSSSETTPISDRLEWVLRDSYDTREELLRA